MINPASYSINIYQGATFELVAQFKGNGVPVDMSGYTVTGKIYDRLGLEELVEFDQSWTDIENGSFVLSVPSGVTATLSSDGQYDVLVKEPTNRSFYILRGTAFVKPAFSWRP
jgi:hypothetical protein